MYVKIQSNLSEKEVYIGFRDFFLFLENILWYVFWNDFQVYNFSKNVSSIWECICPIKYIIPSIN